MIKPRMAEGSRVTTTGGIINDFENEVSLGEHGWLYVYDGFDSIGLRAEDVICVLVEGGKLPLWDAAARVAETAVAMREAFREFGPLNDERVDLHQSFADAVSNLCRVIDDMKEPTP